MSEREEVQREFASGDWHHELGTIYNIEAMADEIVRLRSRLAAVTEECAFLQAGAECMEAAIRTVRDAYNEQRSDSEKDTAWRALMQTLDATPTVRDTST